MLAASGISEWIPITVVVSVFCLNSCVIVNAFLWFIFPTRIYINKNSLSIERKSDRLFGCGIACPSLDLTRSGFCGLLGIPFAGRLLSIFSINNNTVVIIVLPPLSFFQEPLIIYKYIMNDLECNTNIAHYLKEWCNVPSSSVPVRRLAGEQITQAETAEPEKK